MFLNIFKQSIYTLESLDKTYIAVIITNAPFNVLNETMMNHVIEEVVTEPDIPDDPDFIVPEAVPITEVTPPEEPPADPFKPQGDFNPDLYRQRIKDLGFSFEYLSLTTKRPKVHIKGKIKINVNVSKIKLIT